jgi:predicted ATPase
LRVRLEQEFPLSPLPVPSTSDTTVEALIGSPAVRLFVARAQAARPGFVLGPRNAGAVAAICQRLDGLPLAIELAAARVRALTPADILIRLGDRIDLLADPRSDRPDRQRTLEATVAWSYDLLNPAEQTAFRQMAVFAGGCTFEAAEAVLGDVAEPATDPLDLVTALVEQGLLRDEEQPDGTIRFRTLEPVRLFAWERLRESGDEEAARSVHGEYFRELVMSTSQDVDSAVNETAWLDRIAREHDNVRAALDWLLRKNASGALALSVTLWRFWWSRGLWTEAQTWIERSLAQETETPTTERAAALRALGLIADGTGDHQRGLVLLAASLELSRSLGDRHGEWQTLLDLSLVWAARDYGEASRYAEQALAIARELNDPPRIARSLNRLGNCQLNREMPREAVARHREALGILERLGDEQGIAETLDLLGIASVLGADPQGTVHWFTRAVDAWRVIGDQRGLASSLMGLTMAGPNFHTHFAALPAEAVRSAGEESLALSRDIGWRAGEAFALWGFLGMGLGATGDYATALPSAREALVIAQEIEHQQWETGAYCTLGHLYADLCDWGTAKSAYISAFELAREVESLYWTRSAAGWLASTHVHAGELNEAAALIEGSLDDTIPVNTIAGRLLWTAAADLALAQGNPAQVLELADRLAAGTPAPANRAIPRLELLRGRALTELERYPEAKQSLDQAHAAARWSGMRPQLWRIHAARARLHAAQNEPELAEQELEAAQAIVEALAASVPDDALRAVFVERALADSVSLQNAS